MLTNITLITGEPNKVKQMEIMCNRIIHGEQCSADVCSIRQHRRLTNLTVFTHSNCQTLAAAHWTLDDRRLATDHSGTPCCGTAGLDWLTWSVCCRSSSQGRLQRSLECWNQPADWAEWLHHCQPRRLATCTRTKCQQVALPCTKHTQ